MLESLKIHVKMIYVVWIGKKMSLRFDVKLMKQQK